MADKQTTQNNKKNQTNKQIKNKQTNKHTQKKERKKETSKQTMNVIGAPAAQLATALHSGAFDRISVQKKKEYLKLRRKAKGLIMKAHLFSPTLKTYLHTHTNTHQQYFRAIYLGMPAMILYDPWKLRLSTLFLLSNELNASTACCVLMSGSAQAGLASTSGAVYSGGL